MANAASEIKALKAAVKGLPSIAFDEKRKYSAVQTASSGVVSKGPASGTRQNVVGNGMAVGGAVRSGALQNIENGGFAAAVQIQSGGVQRIGDEGAAANVSIASGGLQLVAAYGAATTARVGAGGVQLVSGGAARGAEIGAGGFQRVEAGGITFNAGIASGGTQHVAGGKKAGTANGTVISAGGLQIVQGSAGGAAVYGTQMIAKGGTAAGGVVYQGGKQIIAGGTAGGLRIYGSQIVSGGSVSGISIGKGGSAEAVSAAVADACIRPGGKMTAAGARMFRIAVQKNGSLTAAGSGTVVSGMDVSGAVRLGSGASATDVCISKGTATIMSGASATNVSISKGTAAVMSGAGMGVVFIDRGGTLKAAAGASIAAFSLQGGSFAVHAGTAAQFGAAEAGTMTGTLNLASGASFTIAGAVNMSGLGIRLASGAVLEFSNFKGTALGSLSAAAKSSLRFCINENTPKADFMVSVAAAKMHAGTQCAIVVDDDQKTGTYRLASGLAQTEGAEWTLNDDRIAVNGSAVSCDAIAYRLVSSGGAVLLKASLHAGKMIRGAGKNGTISGTDRCDVFWGCGDGLIECNGGRDVAVYGKGKWGNGVVDNRWCQSLTVLFKGVKKSDVVSSLSDGTMTFVRKSDQTQRITVTNWNEYKDRVVFAGGGAALDKWCAGGTLTAAELKTARTEAWKAAKLA